MNTFARIERMSVRDKAIALAGAVRAHLQGLERKVAKGIALAEGEGVPGVLDKLVIWQAMLSDAHAYASDELAPAIAAAMGDAGPEGVIVYSGGHDDKTPDGSGG